MESGESYQDGTCRRLCNNDADCLGTETCSANKGYCVDRGDSPANTSSSTSAAGTSATAATSASGAGSGGTSFPASSSTDSGTSAGATSGSSSSTDSGASSSSSASVSAGSSFLPSSTSAAGTSTSTSQAVQVRGQVVPVGLQGGGETLRVQGTVRWMTRVQGQTPQGIYVDGVVQ